MSQNTLKVNELHDDADFDENGPSRLMKKRW
ncbi:hypothetical protein SMKC049_01390 [Serratia marcescens]|nr:hypothetical protein SMKC049_01390 [Serratia marcescens]